MADSFTLTVINQSYTKYYPQIYPYCEKTLFNIPKWIFHDIDLYTPIIGVSSIFLTLIIVLPIVYVIKDYLKYKYCKDCVKKKTCEKYKER